jgi:hypothetical protein
MLGGVAIFPRPRADAAPYHPLAIGTSTDFLLAVERRWMGAPHRDRLFFFGV